MNKNTILALIGLFVFNLSFGQDQQKYSDLVREAWTLYEENEFLKSGQKYSEAFVALGNRGMVNDRYNAACSWALANEIDSSFIQLFKMAQNGSYTNYPHISTDTDLQSLHKDLRWQEVLEIIKSNKEKVEANFDKPLFAILDTIYQEDQQYRQQIEELEKKYAWDSKGMQAHYQMIHEKDSVNVIKVKQILDERGWLGPDIIGQQGNQTLFLVIQHADINVQKKYLPMMRKAVKEGNAQSSSLALLEDRIALRTGKKQIYGSQIGRDENGEYYVQSLKHPKHVDKRRSKVGLGTLQDYISNWGLTWDVKEYKKKLAQIEAKQKK